VDLLVQLEQLCYQACVRQFHGPSRRLPDPGRLGHLGGVPALRRHAISAFNRRIHALSRLRLARSSASNRPMSRQIVGGRPRRDALSLLRAARSHCSNAFVRPSIDCAIIQIPGGHATLRLLSRYVSTV
jgi:hypothetical protein